MGQDIDPLSLNLYTYVHNNPINYLDPTGHMPKAILNWISNIYNQGAIADMIDVTTEMLSTTINTLNPHDKNTAIHEIAQVLTAKELYERGYEAELEYKITSTTQKTKILKKPKTYEADIVADGMVWEVKPKNGKDPKPQLELYKKEGNLQLGDVQLETIEKFITNTANGGKVYMRVEYPNPGEVIYSCYLIDKKGKQVELNTNAATYYLDKMIPGIPIPLPQGVPVPVIP